MKKQEKDLFLLGILWAIIGAFIGAIPSILVHNWGNILVAIASLSIPISSYCGYKLAKTAIDRKAYLVIAISSILAITTATFVMVPAVYLLTNGYKASFENLSILYNVPDARVQLIHDYIISLISTFLGTVGTAIYAARQTKEEKIEVNAEKKYVEENSRSKKIIIAVLTTCFLILIVVGYVIAEKNNKKLATETAPKDSSNIIKEIDVETNELEHIISGTGLKFVPKDNLKILTAKQIKEYFGSDVKDYEIIAMDDDKTKMLYMLIDDGEPAQDLDTTQYLRKTFSQDENIEITDVVIAETNFKKVRGKNG
ncbi:MAG: hypothetical protein IKD76_00350 [Clostridia bacterium]|nr:hypothetical protein [Clostridia bacterium]